MTKPIKQEVLLQAIKERSRVAPPSSSKESIPKNQSLVLGFPKLAARIPEFLQNRRQDVITMLDALGRGDLELVARLGHSMKGAGASFGFQTITDLGAALEREGGNVDIEASRRLVGELSAYLEAPVERDAQSIVRLPLEARELTVDALFDRARPAGGARRIVLVEDNEDLRVIFGVTLQQSGHQVKEARDGIEGLACILAERPDVAIIDIGLPGMDGYEVARRVRAALGYSVMLVAMTGSEKESDRLEALSAGFNRHMTKPIDIELVLRILDGCAASGDDPIALKGEPAGDLAILPEDNPPRVVQGAALSREIHPEKSLNLVLESTLRSGFPTGKA